MGAAIAAAVIAAGGAVYAAESQKKSAKSAAQNQRDPAQEVSTFTPEMLKLAQKAGDYQMAANRQSAQDALSLYSQATDRERGATNKQRLQDMNAVNRYGPRLMSYLEKLNPEWATASDRLDAAGKQTPLSQSLNSQANNAGITAINARLYGEAYNDLANGGRLSPDQTRQVQQDSRAAFSARGMLNGDASAFDEILNLQNAQLARQRERQAFAQSASANLLNEQAQNRSFGMGVEGLNLQRGNFLAQSLAAQQARMNPALGILTERSQVPLGTGAALMGSAPKVDGLLQSLLGYGAGANDFNANAAAAARIAAGNNQAALYGSLANTAGKAIEGYQTYQSRQPATTTTTAAASNPYAQYNINTGAYMGAASAPTTV